MEGPLWKSSEYRLNDHRGREANIYPACCLGTTFYPKHSLLGLSMAPDDTIFCTDDGDHSVRRGTPEGKILLTFGTHGTPKPYTGGEPFCHAPTPGSEDGRQVRFYLPDMVNGGMTPDYPNQPGHAEDRAAAMAFLEKLRGTYDVARAIVFGSRARGDHAPDSDLDLSVILNGGRGDFIGIKLDMAASPSMYCWKPAFWCRLFQCGMAISPTRNGSRIPH